MGAKFDNDGLVVTSNVYISCNMFPQARMLHDAGAGSDITEIFGGENRILFSSAKEFSDFAGETLTAEAAMKYFGGRKHYDKIVHQGTQSGRFLPKEPAELMPFFHLILPVRDGVYENGGIKIRLKGLKLIGEPGKNMVAHLGLTFDSHLVDNVVSELLAEQADELGEVLAAMSDYTEFDFTPYEEHLEKMIRGARLVGL